MSKEFRNVLYAIATGLVLWAVKDHVDVGRIREQRLITLEVQMKQVLREQRYYHGRPIAPPTEEEKK